MKKALLSIVAASALVILGTTAFAQPAGTVSSPAPFTTLAPASHASAVAPAASVPTQAGRYTGPSSAALTTIKQLLASGKDDQYARLQGKIIAHEKGKKYTFADDTGRMSIEISPRRFPDGQSISAEQRVEVSGKLEKGWGKTKFETKELRLLP